MTLRGEGAGEVGDLRPIWQGCFHQQHRQIVTTQKTNMMSAGEAEHTEAWYQGIRRAKLDGVVVHIS